MKTKLLFATLASIFLLSCMETKKPLIIGHRGAMGHETENTLASIQKAMDLGVDMIEIDVFRIKSGEIVVFHDDNVERLTDGKGQIESYSLSDLKQLTVEGGHKIPTLEEVLDVMAARTLLNIELKGANTAKDVDKIVMEYVKNRNWKLSNFVVSSFNWDELEQMCKVNPEIPIAVLTEKNPLDAIQIAKELKAVAINPYFKKLDQETVKKIKDAGLKIYPWTVNEPEDITAMQSMAVDGIITNYPERIK